MSLSFGSAAIVASGLHQSGDRAKQIAEERKRRAQFAFISSTAEKWLWVTDEKEAFVPAKLVKENPDGSLDVEVGVTQTARTVKKVEIGPPILRVTDLKNSYEDMVRMSDVNEASILHNLRLRFQEDLIYTNIGTILVAINPFKWIENLYTSGLIAEHLNTPVGEVSQPHVFQVAAAAYSGLRSERTNQSVIISGESGAGKTEATKQCLKFFAEAAGSSAAGMAEKLLSANPILEAFGNAKTVRNNNSSRFGKWMEVHFNGRAQICGSQIINYLLEKSRVAFQANGERTYHIFYQLCAATRGELRSHLALGSAEEYSYTNKSNCISVEGLNDVHEYKDLIDSLEKVEVQPAEYEPMFTLVAALLHLSNVVFEPIDSDSCRMSGNPTVAQELKHAARLLGVQADDLRLCLEQKLIETRNERVRTPLSAEKAQDCRNSMGKAIYGRMFDWLVSRVNSAMTGLLSTSANVIGVLDIFGFEIFEINSFEQLCINFCNEKLQQHFNYHVFKAEEKCYQAEQIDYTEIKFVDNQDVLDLVEKKPEGLLPKLDDEVKVPRGSDQGFLEKINKMHHDNPRFKGRVRRGNENRDFEFGVNHYAGTVHYDVRGFIEKNKDELLLNVKELIASSQEAFLQVIFSEDNQSAAQKVAAKAAEAAAGSSSTPSKQPGASTDKQSQSFQFRAQLDALMRTLNATEPHYIRCIKPNNVKKGNIFDAPICLQQLRYAGVFEAVKVRQLGFPFRFTYEVFFKRYRCATADPNLKDLIDKKATNYPWKDKSRAVLKDLAVAAPEHLDPVDKLFKFGRTMVLYRADQHRVLEMIRDHVRDTAARLCTRVFRGHKGRKLWRILVAIRQGMREAIRSRILEKVQAAIVAGRAASFLLFEMKALVVLEARLLEEKACKELLASLYPVDPADHYTAYESALKDAARLDIQDTIVKQCQYKFSTVKDRIETKAALARGIAIGDKALILRALAKADELAVEWGDILGQSVRAAASDTMKVIELEAQVQDDLSAAILVGGPSGPIGALDGSRVETVGLQAAIASAASGRVKINTAMGHNLIATARVLIDLRLALRSGVWANITAAVAAAVALRKEDKLVSDAETEVKACEAEIADKRIQNDLITALSTGALPEHAGELFPRQLDTATLSEAVMRTKAASDAVGGLSATAKHLLNSAELLLRLRQAFAQKGGAEWAVIRRVVVEGMEARLADPCVPELAAAKAELDNHIIVHQLTDALEKGSAVGTVARLDTSVIDTTALADRIAHAEEMGVTTAQAAALLALARIVRRLRDAMSRLDTDALVDIVREAKDVPKEFIPHNTADELLVARYEGENALIVRTLSAGIRHGGAKGVVGAVDRSSIELKFLHIAVKKSTAMKCRSEEALWLLEVAENLAELRDAYLAGQWPALQELVLGLRGLHGSRPSERGADYKLMAQLPVLKPTGPVFTLPGTARNPTSMRAIVPIHGEDAGAGLTPTTSGTGPSPSPPAPIQRSASARTLGSADSPMTGTPLGMMGRSGGVGSSSTSPPQATSTGFPSSNRGRGSSADKRPASLRLTGGVGEISRLSMAGIGGGGRASVSHGPSDDTLEVGFSLPAEVLAEVALIQDELHNHLTVTELTAQLSTGGPVGELGALSGAEAAVDGLAIALKRASRAGFKTFKAASLAYTGHVVRDTRASLKDGDWKTLEATLKSVAANNARVARALGRPLPVSPPPYLALSSGSGSASPAAFAYMSTGALGPVSSASIGMDTASILLSPPGMEEIVRLEAELQYRRTIEHLQAALSVGGASGSVGNLRTDGIDTTSLANAIDAARALGARTPQVRHLTALCRLMWQMRTSVVEGDWAAVESLVAAGASVLGTGPADAKGTEAGLVASPSVLAEAELYKAESSNRRILAMLRAALSAQAVSGEVGRLNMNEVDVSGLQEGIKVALELGMRTPEARSLVSTAVHMRALRLALLGGQWDRLGALLDYYAASEAKSKPYSLYGKTMAGVQAAADAAAASTSMGSPSKSLNLAGARMVTTNTKDGVGSMGWWANVVESGLGSDDRNGSLDLMIEGVATESGPEAALLQLELNNRNVVVELTRALSSGSATGSVGKLDVSSIKTGELDWALEYTARLGCATSEAEALQATAHTVRRIRLALASMNWSALEEALGSARGRVLSDVGATEIAAAQDELDNRVILSELASAMARGRSQGRVGRLFTGSIELSPLNDAIGLSSRLLPKTPEAKQMLFTAKVVARLRGCLLNEDMAEAGLTLEAVRGKLLATVALAEVTAIQDEVDNWSLCKELASALEKGGAGGDIGALDSAGLDITRLEAALGHADELGVKTSEAVALYSTAALVYKLRCALLREDWDGLEGGVQALLDQSATLPVTISDAASGEIELVRSESINRKMVMSLSTALATGGAVGAIGTIDLGGVATSGLDAAIAAAVESGPRTPEAERLLGAAKLIRRLRSVLLAGNWQWVGSVLLEARSMKAAFPPVSLKELQGAQDELDNRAVLAQVRAAMKQGGPSGGIGALDTASIDTVPLVESIAYARSLGVKSKDAETAVGTAVLLRAVRAALRINDYAAAKDALEEAKSSNASLDPIASDELALVGMAVDNWVVTTALTDAVSTGQPQGPLGDADVGTIGVEPLDAAIALTMKLGCNTGEARRCLVSALIVRRLRQAFLDADWPFLAQVVEEASKEGNSLLPPTRLELARGRDTLEFRSVLDSLRTRTAALDEGGLGDALARAAGLGLTSHPRTSVREVVDAAAATLGRVQRVKASLTSATRALDPSALMEGLATAASMGYEHACVESARSTLARIQEQAERSALALKGMDALGMAAALREGEAMGISASLPVLQEIMRVLSVPRAEFLRRELDAVLNSIAQDEISAGESKVGVEGSRPAHERTEEAALVVPSVVPFAPGRAPTSLEARIVNCTVQVKDMFFADAPAVDDIITHALGSSSLASSSLGRSTSRLPGAASPAAQAAIAQMRTARHMEDNVKGASARVLSGTVTLPNGTSIPLVLWTCPVGTPFKPGGFGRALLVGTGPSQSTALAAQPAAAVVGTVTPPSHSPLRRQFGLDKYPRLKPPHMFSSKFSPSTTLAESGMLRWTCDPIGTPLTLLASTEARKAAVRTFRHMLAFMGDRPLSRPALLAQDILATGVAVPEVRDEIFLQLAKQLSNNPSSSSAERGWVLLYLALCTFPPSEELENILEVWLREAGAVPCVWALHLSLYRGGPGKSGIPSATEVSAALERARAPGLPAYASPDTDGDSAASLVEYTTTGLLPVGEDFSGTRSSAAFHGNGKGYGLGLGSPMSRHGGASIIGPLAVTAVDDDDHRTQLAFLQAVVDRALPAGKTGQGAKSAKAGVEAAVAASQDKKVTPTKPTSDPVASDTKAGEYLTGVASASMDRISSLLSAGAGAAVSQARAVPVTAPAPGDRSAAHTRPTTPTRPGASHGHAIAAGPMPLFSPVAVTRPTTGASGLASPAPARPVLGSASTGMGGHVGLDAELEVKIAAISRQLENY